LLIKYGFKIKVLSRYGIKKILIKIFTFEDLTCDFSKRALNCQWANLEKLNDGMSQWEIGILSSAKNTKTSEDILIPGSC